MAYANQVSEGVKVNAKFMGRAAFGERAKPSPTQSMAGHEVDISVVQTSRIENNPYYCWTKNVCNANHHRATEQATSE